MGETALEQVTIDGISYTYRFDQEEKLHIFETGSANFQFRDWKFGEKNDAVQACILFDESTGNFNVDTHQYSTCLLAGSLVRGSLDGKEIVTDASAIHNLKASTGDQLFSLALWINSSERLKKELQTRDPGAEFFTASIGEDSYSFREWTWGEKNQAAGRCIISAPGSVEYIINTALFNELMLAATLAKAPFTVNRETIRQLPACLGDILVELAQKVNHLAEDEKKN